MSATMMTAATTMIPPEHFPDNNMLNDTYLYKPAHTILKIVPYPHLTRNAFLYIKTFFMLKMLQKKTESF